MLGTPSHPAINGMLPPKPSSWISIIGPWWPSGDVHSVSPERTCVRSGNMYNYSTHEYVHIYYVYNMVYIYTYLEMYISCLYIHRVYIYIYDIWYMICVYIIIYCMQSYAYMVLPAALPAWYCRPIPSEAQNLDYYIEVPRIYYIMLHKCLCSSHITAVIKIQ